MSSFQSKLNQFDAVEANLKKCENLLQKIMKLIPEGIDYSENDRYDDICKDFQNIYSTLPMFNNWKPDIEFLELDEIAHNRLEAADVGEFESKVYVEKQIYAPVKALKDYRYKFDRTRADFVRESIIGKMSLIDSLLDKLNNALRSKPEDEGHESVNEKEFDALIQQVDQLEMLIGRTFEKPRRWGDLQRHLHFRLYHDLYDIIESDWPVVKSGLHKVLYGESTPVPIAINDLGIMASEKGTSCSITTELKWSDIDDSEFERVIYCLISSEDTYKNPKWLTKTNASDRGRDLSVDRVRDDPLGDTVVERVIIQCKHWLSKSIAIDDISRLDSQMELWGQPVVNTCVIATSGRFTTDAIAFIEQHNQKGRAPRIEMWPESHLERILARKPEILSQFKLR